MDGARLCLVHITQKLTKKSESFLKNFPEIVSKTLSGVNDNKPIAILAQDEGRFGRVSIPKSSWAPSGIRPEVPRQVVRESFYVYSAICPKLGKMTSLILPHSNTDMMNIFLEEVSKDFADYTVIMQLDGAGWHKSKDLKIPENIKLIFQPPYSPELNPVEHLWDELREKHLHNKIFDTIEDVMDIINAGLQDLNKDPDRITSMTYFPHLRVS